MKFLFIIYLAFLSSFSHAGITKAPPVLQHVGGNVWEAVPGMGNTISTTRTWATGTAVQPAKATDVLTWMYREKHKIPLNVVQKVPASAVVRIAAKTFPLVGTASIAYDLWKELGCDFVNGSVLCEELVDPKSEILERWVTNYPALEAPTAWGLCTKYAALYNMLPKELLPGDYDSQRVCRYGTQQQIDSGSFYGGVLLTRLDPGTPGYRCPDGEVFIGDKCTGGQPKPCDEECLVDRAGKAPGVNGQPNPGFVDKAPGIAKEGTDNGVEVPGSVPEVSGPSVVPGPTGSSTTTSPSGESQTVTTSTNYHITYNGNQITVNEVTTTTHPDGSTTTESTDDVPSDVAPPSDPDMPQVPTLYEKKFPDGLQGVWANRKSELLNTPIFAFLTSLVPSTGDGGCPSWQLPVMYGINNTSVVDISIPCWIWSAIRAIFVVTALFSCRRIIFGG